jgi:hypothetical protein
VGWKKAVPLAILWLAESYAVYYFLRTGIIFSAHKPFVSIYDADTPFKIFRELGFPWVQIKSILYTFPAYWVVWSIAVFHANNREKLFLAFSALMAGLCLVNIDFLRITALGIPGFWIAYKVLHDKLSAKKFNYLLTTTAIVTTVWGMFYNQVLMDPNRGFIWLLKQVHLWYH